MPDIVPGGASDLPQIMALLESNGLPIAGLGEHLGAILVARDRDTVVGCAAVEIYGSSGLLRSVAVAKDRRGTGLGQWLTRAALDLAGTRGVRTIYLLTTTAAEFFPRFGFARVSRDAIDLALQQSHELRGACPATAIAMKATLTE